MNQLTLSRARQGINIRISWRERETVEVAEWGEEGNNQQKKIKYSKAY